MTIGECIVILAAKVKCMKRKTSGTNRFCNSQCCDDCYLNYDQGTMGEQKEALAFALTIIRRYCQIMLIYKQWSEELDFKSNQAMIKIGEVLKGDDKG